GSEVGWMLTTLRPNADRSFEYLSEAHLSLTAKDQTAKKPAARLAVQSSFSISPQGRLDRFKILASIDEQNLEIRANGKVHGNELEVTLEGFAEHATSLRVAIDPEMILVDRFAPVDHLPGLVVGKKWTSHVVNPASALLPRFNLFGGDKM